MDQDCGSGPRGAVPLCSGMLQVLSPVQTDMMQGKHMMLKCGHCRSRREDGSEDPASLHAAEKVIRGEKWICSRWFKAPSSRLAGGDDNPRAPEP